MDKKMFDMSEFYRECESGNCNLNIDKGENHMQSSKDNGDCEYVLAMAFVNMQPLDSVYPARDAYSNGTLFPSLNKPFLGGKKR